MRFLSVLVVGALAGCGDTATQVLSPDACDGACSDTGADAATDARHDAAGEAATDAGQPAPTDPGVSCGPVACDNSLPCCARSQSNGLTWQYTCSLNCAAADAGEAHKFVCDDSADCPPSSVCCSSGATGVIDATHCASAASCANTLGAVVCDPANAPECPGKCTRATSSGGLAFHTCE